ncbi:MAG: glycosyltransferase [Gammaproteobacteria bacterium]|nr:glycosyltransferase [Gammaproteobacteria bacterium]MBV8405248.1 glycosyltransferase [Gammaproteobacteria bacterium]
MPDPEGVWHSMSFSQRQPVPRIGVVIPYFQRTPRLLHRALTSVAAQQYRPVEVVIVDDGSPRTAAEELTAELRNSFSRVTVVRQVNRGVAAARNAGLDALGADVTAVALLDSDDCWKPTHLRNAAAALEAGADFFFSNTKSADETTDVLSRHPLRDQLRSSAPVQAAVPHLVRWSGGVAALFVRGTVFHTSAVVFRRALMPEVRFPVDFLRAGEDQVAFWNLLCRAAVIMACTEPTVMAAARGGVGIWRNSTFGSPAHLERLADEIKWRRYMLTAPSPRSMLTTRDRQLVRSAIAARRNSALDSVLHLLLQRQSPLSEMRYLFRSDPLCAASWCAYLPRVLYRKARRLADSGRFAN